MKEFSLEEYLKNPNREVVTRDGRKVRIICTDRKGDTPIIALVYDANEGQEYGYAFYSDGKYFIDKDDEFDLFFAPTKHEGWIIINKWPDGERDTNGIIYDTESDVPDMSPIGGKRVATIKIEWEE
nr:MAG TPA: uranyl binding protein [Caudoviricetes sp.]